MTFAKMNYHQLVSGERDVRERIRKGLVSLLLRQCSVSLAVLLVFILIQNEGWSQVNAPPQKAARFREDRILIKPKTGLLPAALASFHAAGQAEVLRTFHGLGNIQVLRVPKGETVQSLIAKYQRSGLVKYAEPDFQLRLAAATPNDPKFLNGTLWGLHNTGQTGGVADADIDAPAGWGTLNSASNVIVAVIDTGVRYTHEDLAANMWVNPQDGSHGLNATDVLNISNDPNDDYGHGTLVAGILGATGNNGLGVVGVAWRIQIMACKFIGPSTEGDIENAIACIEFARTNGAHIINASWGLNDFSASLYDAIDATRSAGIIFVAAAGNDARDTDAMPFYPASFDLDNIVSVAATTRIDDLYSLSNFGATSVDLAAPGRQIFSTYIESDSSYALDEGTSMATPHVVGAFALVRAKYPMETHTQLINRVLAATDPLPTLAGKCVTGGRLNLRKALGQSEPAAAHLTLLTLTNGEPFQLRLDGEPERSYAIEVTTNFVNWTPVSTNSTALDGSYLFSEPANGEQRFYRALSVP